MCYLQAYTLLQAAFCYPSVLCATIRMLHAVLVCVPDATCTLLSPASSFQRNFFLCGTLFYVPACSCCSGFATSSSVTDLRSCHRLIQSNKVDQCESAWVRSAHG
ncbi:hypothetical protein E2C01_022029 [Portunus trituberculatus]|uniref:Uncharacterized protein n=1 Tax=Portunus trituberculatus TaxID=210409 RepID=A0A5B7E4Y7_PORTR|nr:hypothetical protein [Portunus trituberculatus]